MSISIHYSGVVDLDKIEPLCQKLAAIAEKQNFDPSLWVDGSEKGLRGIILNPNSALGPIPFLFDAEGQLHAYGDFVEGWTVKDAILSVAVKTLEAGSGAHIWLINLLVDLQQQNDLSTLKVFDDSGYLQHGDLAKLERRMESFRKKSKDFCSVLDGAMITPNDK